MTIAQRMLFEVDHEMATTRRVLERVPDEKWDWKPHPTSMSLGVLANHVAEIANWGTTTVTSDELDMMPDGKPPERKLPATAAEVLGNFDKWSKEFRAALDGPSDAAMGAHWKLLTNKQVIFEMPRAGVLRGFVISHMIHHRAQLAVYFRMLEVPVPSIYGPSKDEDSFKQ